MLPATDRSGNPLFAPIPHYALTPERLVKIGPALPVYLVLAARARGDGAVDGGRPVSIAELAACTGLAARTVRRYMRELVDAGVVRELKAPGQAGVIHLSTGYFWGRAVSGRGGAAVSGQGRAAKSALFEQLELPLDVEVRRKSQKSTAAPSAAVPQTGEQNPQPPQEPAARSSQAAWAEAVRAGLNGTASRRPDVARAVYGAASRYAREHPALDPEALTRAVDQFCRTVVDRGLFPAVTPWQYLPTAIERKAWTTVEERLEREAAERRAELARERRLARS